MTDDQAATGTRQQWRKLPYDVVPSDLHFRQSDALVRLSQQPTLWWHSTERPTLILGAGQARFDLSRCEAAGVLAVRRHAGGTAVYADAGVVGLDVMLPTGHPLALPDVVQTYRHFGEIWNGCLRSMGISAHLVSVAVASGSLTLIVMGKSWGQPCTALRLPSYSCGRGPACSKPAKLVDHKILHYFSMRTLHERR